MKVDDGRVARYAATAMELAQRRLPERWRMTTASGGILDLDRPAASGGDGCVEPCGMSDSLVERVKELNCIYSLSSVLKGHQELGEILQKVADVLPSAWQYPDLARAAITLKGTRFVTQDFGDLLCCEQASIVVNGTPEGLVEVGYVRSLPDGRAPSFLKEERLLLSMVAERIADIVALRESQSQLSTYQEHLRSLASELTLAEERQRRTLALALHDRIGQGLAVAKLRVETLRFVLPAEHQARLGDISLLIKQIVNDTRSLTFEISPPILYELGLRPAIIWLGEHVTRQFGLAVTVRCDNDVVRVSEGVRVMLFRSVQELLTNAVKHARARRATILLQEDADVLCVVVEDDGIGFDAEATGRIPSETGGFGLFSIRERIHHLGGEVDVWSRPGKGTRVRIAVPREDAATES